MKKGFTLAEIMIVLSVIGILTAILLPVAFHSAPNEEAMKFKKANSTLGTMIRELVNSDRYYADGDLGMKAAGGDGENGSQLKGTGTTAETDKKYFCTSLADIMSTKSVNCTDKAGETSKKYLRTINTNNGEPTEALLNTLKSDLDDICKGSAATGIAPEIVSSDNISWYQASPAIPFGWEETDGKRTFAAPNAAPSDPKYTDQFGFDAVYKVFCFDVDEINYGEDPFGYGIRADGKIIPGARADEWIKKSVQKGDDE